MKIEEDEKIELVGEFLAIITLVILWFGGITIYLITN